MDFVDYHNMKISKDTLTSWWFLWYCNALIEMSSFIQWTRCRTECLWEVLFLIECFRSRPGTRIGPNSWIGCNFNERREAVLALSVGGYTNHSSPSRVSYKNFSTPKQTFYLPPPAQHSNYRPNRICCVLCITYWIMSVVFKPIYIELCCKPKILSADFLMEINLCISPAARCTCIYTYKVLDYIPIVTNTSQYNTLCFSQ